MSNINIVKATSTVNTTALAGRNIKYIVIHYTAGTSSKAGTAKNVAAMFGRGAVAASADFIVDDENIVQYNPDPKNRYTWAVGGSKYNTKGGSLYGVAKNSNTISIEVCSTNTTNAKAPANDKAWSFTAAVLDKAVELTKYLMEVYGIDAAHVIRHYDVNGKPCPGIIGWNADTGSEEKWTEFKARLTGTSKTTSTTTTPKKEEEDMTKEEVKKIVEEILLAKDQTVSSSLSAEWNEAKKAGITDGSRPAGYATREQVAAMIVRAIKD